ncbi:hypothetical protein QLH52_06510 [Methylomonas sp. OY6]|uniref:Uncharacterized protein n=1 Tax=Methylomonas defluvii TaxID=3045149 RepID=A0ABU4UCM5_9GAMM|nr:hypothetical protein [Methylomonas sp. OY6]MDX8126926.1 hypothetical protein [Methylomonas sp. OY6]
MIDRSLLEVSSYRIFIRSQLIISTVIALLEALAMLLMDKLPITRPWLDR